MGCPVGEEPRDQRLGRKAIALLAGLLHHASNDETAHRVSGHEYLVGAGLLADGEDQVVQTLGRLLDVEAIGGDPIVQAFPDTLEQTFVLRRRHEGGRGLVVEPVHPQRRVRDRAVLGAVQVLALVASNEEPVVLIGDEPEHGALELVEHRVPVTANSHMGRPEVEAIERVVNLAVDAGCGSGVPTHIHDRESVHEASRLRRSKRVGLYAYLSISPSRCAGCR